MILREMISSGYAAPPLTLSPGHWVRHPVGVPGLGTWPFRTVIRPSEAVRSGRFNGEVLEVLVFLD